MSELEPLPCDCPSCAKGGPRNGIYWVDVSGLFAAYDNGAIVASGDFTAVEVALARHRESKTTTTNGQPGKEGADATADL